MEKDDTKYLHAAARVHSLENQLISQQDLLKAIEAANAEDAFKSLAGKEMFRDVTAGDYEAAFERDLLRTYQLLENITEQSEVTYVFRYPADGHNLKVYVKAKLADGDFGHLYKKTGTFTPEQMEAELAAKRFEKVPPVLGEAALEAEDQLAKTRDSQIVDIIIDKAVLTLMKQKAVELDNRLLIEYVESKIDLINIETAVRLIRMKKDAYEVRRIFAEGGTIDPRDIDEGYSAGYEGISRLLDKAGKRRRMEKSVPALRHGEPLTVFEQNLDGCFKDLFDKAKVIPFGLEPVIAFLYLKEREIRAARLVLVSKVFGLPKEQIVERLRYIYAD